MMSSLIKVLLLIDIELSYINTNHEDFIGFAKYVHPPSLVQLAACFQNLKSQYRHRESD